VRFRPSSLSHWFGVALLAIGSLAPSPGSSADRATHPADRAIELSNQLWNGSTTTAERIRICDALRDMGPEASPAAEALVSMLSHGGALHAHVRDALKHIGPQALPMLCAGLIDANVVIRGECASLLAELGPQAKKATADVLWLLKQGDAESVQLAATVAEGIGADAAVAIPALVKALGNDESAVRSAALHALAAVDPDAPRELYPAIADLQGTFPAREREAIKTLGGLGPRAARAVPMLVGLLSAPVSGTRDAAAAAINHIGAVDSAGAEALLHAIEQHPDEPLVRKVAMDQLSANDASIPVFLPAWFPRCKPTPRPTSPVKSSASSARAPRRRRAT